MSPAEAMRLLRADGKPEPPASPPSTSSTGATGLDGAVQHETDLLRQQLAQAHADGDREGARALSALLDDPDKLSAYVGERAQIAGLYDGLFPQGGGPGIEKDAFVNAAQAERSRLAAEIQATRESGDREGVRALDALLADPQKASSYVLERTLLSLSYESARRDPQAAALIEGLGKDEYTSIVQRAQADLRDQRLELRAELDGADALERAAIAQQLASLAEHGDDLIGLRLATASEEHRLQAALSGGALDAATADYYRGLLSNPGKLDERVVLGQMYDAELAQARAQGPAAEQTFLSQAGSRDAFLQVTQEYRASYAAEYEVQKQAAGAAAQAAGQDPTAASADLALVDARTQLALLYKDAQAGKGDPELVKLVQAGDLPIEEFLRAGVGRFEAKRALQQADVDITKALREMNPGLAAEQAQADAHAYNALFFEISDSEASFQNKVAVFDSMPAFYRGASRVQIGADDVYAQKDEIARQYNAINAKFADYENLVRTGKGGTPEAKALDAEIRAMLAPADALSQRSIDASLGRAATAGPVIDMATDLIVFGASTFIPGGWAIAGGFSTMKGGMRGEVTDLGSGVLAFAKGAAFAKLGALGKAEFFTGAGVAAVKLLPAGLQGIKWLPAVTGIVLENGAQALTSAGFTAADLARRGEFDAGVVARVGAESFAFGLLSAGVSRGGNALGERLLDTRLLGLVSPELGRVGVRVVVGGLDSATNDVLSQLSQNGEVDGGRVVLAGLSGMGTTAALTHASILEQGEGRRGVPVPDVSTDDTAVADSLPEPKPVAADPEISPSALEETPVEGATWVAEAAAAASLADLPPASAEPTSAPSIRPSSDPPEPVVPHPANPSADPQLRPPAPVTGFDSFMESLRDPEGRVVDSRKGVTYEPGSPQENAFQDGLREDGFEPGLWGTRYEEGIAYPPRTSGISPDMQQAVLDGLAAYAEATGRVVKGLGARESDPDGTFWHSIDNVSGGPAYESKPGSTITIPETGLLLQAELGAASWGVVHSEKEHVINAEAAAEIAALQAQAGGDPQRLQALLDETNRLNVSQGNEARYVIHEGEVIQIRRYVSDLDIAYATDQNGRPLTDDEIVAMGRYINAAYQAMGYTISLVNHGAHFNGMLLSEYNENYRLTWKYQDKPIYNFTPEGYQGTTRLLDTFKYVYNEPDWPVVDFPGKEGTADQYRVHLPTVFDPKLPEAPPEIPPAASGSGPDSGVRQMPMELDFTGLPWEGWENGPLSPSARAALRSETVQPSRPKDPNARAAGRAATIRPEMDDTNQQALWLQNEAADVLAQAGYDVYHRGEAPGPDYLIEGHSFECLAPGTADANGVWDQMKEKVLEGTPRLVLSLGRARVDVGVLKSLLENYPIRNLKEVLIITPEGGIAQLWP